MAVCATECAAFALGQRSFSQRLHARVAAVLAGHKGRGGLGGAVIPVASGGGLVGGVVQAVQKPGVAAELHNLDHSARQGRQPRQIAAVALCRVRHGPKGKAGNGCEGAVTHLFSWGEGGLGPIGTGCPAALALAACCWCCSYCCCLSTSAPTNSEKWYLANAGRLIMDLE